MSSSRAADLSLTEKCYYIVIPTRPGVSYIGLLQVVRRGVTVSYIFLNFRDAGLRNKRTVLPTVLSSGFLMNEIWVHLVRAIVIFRLQLTGKVIQSVCARRHWMSTVRITA